MMESMSNDRAALRGVVAATRIAARHRTRAQFVDDICHDVTTSSMPSDAMIHLKRRRRCDATSAGRRRQGPLVACILLDS